MNFSDDARLISKEKPLHRACEISKKNNPEFVIGRQVSQRHHDHNQSDDDRLFLVRILFLMATPGCSHPSHDYFTPASHSPTFSFPRQSVSVGAGDYFGQWLVGIGYVVHKYHTVPVMHKNPLDQLRFDIFNKTLPMYW